MSLEPRHIYTPSRHQKKNPPNKKARKMAPPFGAAKAKAGAKAGASGDVKRFSMLLGMGGVLH